MRMLEGTHNLQKKFFNVDGSEGGMSVEYKKKIFVKDNAALE